METYFKQLPVEEWDKHIAFFKKKANPDVVDKILSKEGILYRSTSKLTPEYKYYVGDCVYIYAMPGSKKDAKYYLYRFPESYEGREVYIYFPNSYFHQMMHECGYHRENKKYKVVLEKERLEKEMDTKLAKVKRKWILLIVGLCILYIGTSVLNVIFSYNFNTKSELDISMLEERDQKLIDEFYSVDPETISKGDLFDLKYYTYNKNSLLGDRILIVKKTMDEIDFDVNVYVNESDEYFSLEDDVMVEANSLKYFNSNIGFLFFNQRSNENTSWDTYQDYENDQMDIISKEMEDILIEITYEGKTENHYLKANQEQMLASIDRYTISDTDLLYFNLLYDLDQNAWLQKIQLYLAENKDYDYNLLFENVYDDRNIGGENARYLYSIIKGKVLNNEYQEADSNYEIPIMRLTFPLLRLYPMINDEEGKKEILQHLQIMINQKKNGNDFEYVKSETSEGEEEIYNVEPLRVTYFQLLYLTSKEQYFNEIFTFLDNYGLDKSAIDSDYSLIDYQSYLSCILNDKNLTEEEATIVYGKLGGSISKNDSFTRELYEKCREVNPKLKRREIYEWFED